MSSLSKSWGPAMLNNPVVAYQTTGNVKCNVLAFIITESLAHASPAKLQFTWTPQGGVPVPLCAPTDITNAPAGTIFQLNGNPAAPLIKSAVCTGNPILLPGPNGIIMADISGNPQAGQAGPYMEWADTTEAWVM